MPTEPTRRHLLAGGLATAAAFAAPLAWAGEGGAIPAAALQEDVRLFRRAYEALHPGLHRYNTPAEMSARFDRLATSLSRPTTLAQAQLAFARTVAAVRCGHSYLNPYNAEGAEAAMIGAGQTRLPFRFAWIGDRMVLLDDSPAHPSLRRGAQVSAVGGVPSTQLRRELMALANADGSNDAKRRRLTELRGEDSWQLTDIYLPLLHPEAVRGGVTRLTVHAPEGGPLRTVEAPLLTRAERTAGLVADIEAGSADRPIWRTERLADGAGYLRMRTWALYDSKWDWRAALDADLDALASDGAPGLIVDLRGNGGGQDVGDLILDRVGAGAQRDAGFRRLVRYRRTPDDLNRFLDTWDKSFRDWGADAVGPDAQGFYRLTRYDDDPAEVSGFGGKRPFKGRLVVLVDAANSSATFQFAAAVKRSGAGVLVGETTGGNLRGINGGAFFFLRLPGSGLEIDLPLIGLFPDTPQPDAGVEPDVAVQVSAADIAAGRDPALAAAVRLLKA